jgi:hypothetical protein
MHSGETQINKVPSPWDSPQILEGHFYIPGNVLFSMVKKEPMFYFLDG